jgi:cytochrome c oxidase subunit IV
MAEHNEGHGGSRKQYLVIFLVLAVLTVLEVAVAMPQMKIAAALKASALILLALTKAALVGLYFMHLKWEMKALKLTVALPFAFPALYAFVLIAEASWRLFWPSPGAHP